MKAVSELLAGVLMIAFVLAVAAIVGGWLTSMTRTETSTIETGMVSQINCSKGGITIVDVSGFNTVVVHNIGYIDLTGGFSVACNSSVATVSTTTNLVIGNITKMTATGVCNSTNTRVRVSSLSCPNVWAERTM